MTRLLASVPIEWGNPINVIIGVLENSIGWVLAAIYSVVPSYGIAIILLTILIRLLLFPIMSRSTKSMRKMQQLQPYVKKLQEKHKNDRQKLSEEQMALFRANNVSPVSGCLPLLIQMPILFAMFRVINGPRGTRDPGSASTAYIPDTSQLAKDLQGTSIDHAGAASFLGMNLALSPLQAYNELGLVSAIPYFIVVALIVLTGWYQQKQIQARNAAQGSQQDVPQAMRTMTRIFPIFFGLISVSLPAGVNVYFLTSNLFQIGQQYLIIRRSGPDDEVVIPKALDKKSGGARAGGAEKKGASSGPKSSGGQGARSRTTPKAGSSDGAQRKKPPKKVAPKSKLGPNQGSRGTGGSDGGPPAGNGGATGGTNGRNQKKKRS